MERASANLQQARRIGTTLLAFAFAAFLLAAAIFGASNWAISHTDYGFPLTFFRVHALGPVIPFLSAYRNDSIVRQLFMAPLAFDVAFAAFVATSAAFSIYRWSASWTFRAYLVFYAICGSICVPLFVSLPGPIAVEYLVVDLLATTSLFVGFTVFTAWSSATRWWGNRAGPIALALVACAIVGSGYSACAHDAFLDPDLR